MFRQPVIHHPAAGRPDFGEFSFGKRISPLILSRFNLQPRAAQHGYSTWGTAWGHKLG